VSIDSRFRIAIVLFLILGAIGFFYLHYKKAAKPEPRKTYWSFKIKPNKPPPHFFCEANQAYLFYSNYGFSSISINGTKYQSNLSRKTKSFYISFEKDRKVFLDCYEGGHIFKSGRLVIRAIKDLKYPRLIWFRKDSYTKPLFKVSKGMRLDLPKLPECFYLGYFKNGFKDHEQLLKIDYPYNRPKHLRFWDSYDIRFKASEVPFLMTIDGEPYFEPLELTYGQYQAYRGGHGGRIKKKTFQQAYYLKPKEVIKTPFYLDEGDVVTIGYKTICPKIECSTDGRIWLKPSGIYEQVWKYRAKKTGYLRIRAKEYCSITSIVLSHNKTWQLNLKPGQSKRIEMAPGDILDSRSRSRYYVNGQILEPKVRNIHRANKKMSIEFKGSVNPRLIYVRVFSRRGY
jgi:hypothetical protein